MELPGPLLKAKFIRREGRFKGVVQIDGEQRSVHVHDPGRLTELLKPGVEVLVRPHPRPGLKTELYLTAVLNNCTVFVDSALHSKIVEEALNQGAIKELKEYSVLRKEYRINEGRVDFLLKGPRSEALLEVKGCTLVKDGVALFPDAPTIRGVKHVKGLAKALSEGYEAFVLFLIAHCKAKEFRPNFEVDPAFSHALLTAAREGVEVLAYKVDVRGREVRLQRPIPVKLEPPPLPPRPP